MAIIQPSYFESWNTTVEDAKLLGKYIILSNLTVHKEQIRDNVYFFNPDNFEELSAAMEYVLKNDPVQIKPYGYDKDVAGFAKDIINMLD